MLFHPNQLIKRAQKEGWALGAFNIYNLETALGIARAAVQEHSPIVLQVSEGTIEYAGLKPITHIMSTIAKNEAASVPVVLHLDHGKSFESVTACIAAGFYSVHIDASSLAYDENIVLTRQVVELAHPKDVWVQGELGSIPGAYRVGKKIKGEIPLVDPEQVSEFVKKTKVNSLAIAVGTAHGMYKEEKIYFDLLQKVRKKTGVPLVLHGASGISDGDIKKAIKCGISKINIGTNIKMAFINAVSNEFKKHPRVQDVRDLLGPGIEAVTKVVKNHLKVIGSSNKA